jgi:hypothetical protein
MEANNMNNKMLRRGPEAGIPLPYVIVSIVLSVLCIVTCSSQGDYDKAFRIYHSSDPERHVKALQILENIPYQFTMIENTDLSFQNPTYQKVQELKEEIRKDYIEYEKDELIQKYSNTRIAYLNNGLNIISLDLKINLHIPVFVEGAPRWSPDGKYIAVFGKTAQENYMDGNRILLYDQNGKFIEKLT